MRARLASLAAARRRHPVLSIVAAIVVAALVASVGGFGYFSWRLGQVARVHFQSSVLGKPGKGQGMNVLLVGSDSRAHIASSDTQKFGSAQQVDSQRSDTIMIMRLEPGTNKAVLMSVPRDLWVPVAGTSSSNRVNTALERSPQALVATIEQSLGIPIHHYAAVEFSGFRNIVDAVGGVPMYVPAPARDPMSGLDIPKAGCQTLNGDQALSWVRSRYYQSFEGGRWLPDPTSDLGRIQRQQEFVRRLMKRARARATFNPLVANRLIGASVTSLTLDDRLSQIDALRLANRLRSIPPAAIESMTLPTVPTTIGGADVLRLKYPDARAAIARFNAAGTTSAAPQGSSPPSDGQAPTTTASAAPAAGPAAC